MTDKKDLPVSSTTGAQTSETKPELTDEEIASVAGGISTSTGGTGPHGVTNTVPIKSPVKA
jgi:hypothetical protein